MAVAASWLNPAAVIAARMLPPIIATPTARIETEDSSSLWVSLPIDPRLPREVPSPLVR